MRIKDLQKERIKTKKEGDAIRANVLMMLIDTIQKMAKETQENADEFIVKGLKKYIKQTEDAIKNGVEDAKRELEILKEYAKDILPRELTEDEIKQKVQEIISKIEKPNMGKVMGELKKIEGVNMKKASQIVKDML